MLIETYIIREIQELNATFQALNSLPVNPASVELCTSEYWLNNWLAYYPRSQDKMFVCCHRFGKQLIAVYPLYLKKIAFGYELRFIGTGEPEHAEVCSEFQDFIIVPAYLQQSLTLFTEQIKQLKNCYRICFNNILTESNCYSWLKNYQKPGWYFQEIYVGKRYILQIACDELNQIKQLPQSTLRRHARRFIERGDITVKYCLQQKELPIFFEELISLHNLQWQQRGKPGAFSSELFRRFHQDLASNMLKKNKLLLFKLSHNNITIGIFYGFYQKNTLYFYQSGINVITPLLNTGIALHLIAMRDARFRNVKFYDLMKGEGNGYKNQYVNTSNLVYSVELNNLFLQTLRFFKKLISLTSMTAKKIYNVTHM